MSQRLEPDAQTAAEQRQPLLSARLRADAPGASSRLRAVKSAKIAAADIAAISFAIAAAILSYRRIGHRIAVADPFLSFFVIAYGLP
jgi:hypothetical protein